MVLSSNSSYSGFDIHFQLWRKIEELQYKGGVKALVETLERLF